MATKKDLVEAYTFSKRRLVTAFISGAPGGREVEPVKPGRVLIGGIALSVLLLAGAAIAGFLIGRPNSQWLETGSFVTSKDTGEQYVVLEGGDDPVIRRVPNYISAQLLLGESDLTPYQVRDKYIRQVTLGEDLGIDDAPAGLPEPDELIQDGWTACTAEDAGIRLSLQNEHIMRVLTNSAFLVRSGPDLWLLASDTEGDDGRGFRYAMPQNPTQAGTLADRLGFGSIDDAPKVSADWLNLFPLGPALDEAEFAVTRKGQPAKYPSGVDTDLSRYRIGDLLREPNGGAYLLADDGPQQLSAFAADLYEVVGAAAQELEVALDARFGSPGYPTQWPELIPTANRAGEMCAVLHPRAGESAQVMLGDRPEGDDSPSGLDPKTTDVVVEPAGGAYVRSGSDDENDQGSPYVIDSAGYMYPLIGAEVPGYIGYGDVDPPVVPNAWMNFFLDKGVSLSVNQARRVPEDAPPSESPEDESAASE